MSLRACFCVALLLAALPVERTRGAAQGVAIEHKAIGCVVADRYPVVEASFRPADAGVRGRVYFRAGSTPHWYYVEMRPQGASFYGTLPKPLKSTRKIEYYIEAADRSLNEARTADPPTTTMPACPACYAGNWQFTATLVARGNPPLCGSPDPQVVATFPVNADGTFRLQTDCSPPGTISAAGIVSFTLAGDTCPGTPPGRTYPAGGGTGTCSSISSCSGTFSQGGDQYTWVMRRLSP